MKLNLFYCKYFVWADTRPAPTFDKKFSVYYEKKVVEGELLSHNCVRINRGEFWGLSEDSPCSNILHRGLSKFHNDKPETPCHGT